MGFAEGETEAQRGWDLAEVSGEDHGICGSPMYGRMSRQCSLRSKDLKCSIQS